MLTEQQMECHCIQHTLIPHSSRLFTDFLYHFERVRPFYSFEPFRVQSFFEAAKAIQYPEQQRAAVAAALEEQAARFGAGDAARRNLERFRRGALALVTGQQVGLYGGPAYSFYKALTAARLAEWLTSQGLDCVPVFWLATEDHDLHEINHAFLLDDAYEFHRVEDAGGEHTPNAPVGDVPLSAAAGEETERAIAMLPKTEWAARMAEAMRSSYRPGATFGDAFGRMMGALLERFGLLQFDPNHPALRAASAGVMRRAIENTAELGFRLAERGKELARIGYHAQVHVTEQTTLFFLNEGGERTPVRRRNGDFAVGAARFTASEMLARLDERPEDFSPNVLLRPIVQDVLLPTVSYVGGPAELAYMAQASAVYDRLLGRMPVIFPRASFTLLDQHASGILARYELGVLDVLAGPQVMRDKMALHHLSPDLAAAFADYEKRLQAIVSDLQARMERFDHTLADAAATAARKMTYQLGKIKRKAGRATGLQTGDLEADARLLENLIHPRKNLQERVYSGVSFVAKFGPQLLDRLYERISPRCADHQVVTL